MLSRKQMEDAIRAGGSVSHNGRIISRVENLPSAASLAKSDEEKEMVAADLDAQIEALQKQRAVLDGKVEKSTVAKNEDDKTTSSPDGLPEDFPAKKVFAELGFNSVEEVQSKTREELIALKGIGDASADAALAYGKK